MKLFKQDTPMFHGVIQEDADIFKQPPVDDRCIAQPNLQITLGDLHANTMKLLFVLIKHGIAGSIDPPDYETLTTLYLKPTGTLSQKDLRLFNKILDSMSFDNRTTLRLIGDELGDRGSNDYFTLQVLDRLWQHRVPVEILLSNHGVEFIQSYECLRNKHPFYPHWLGPRQARSMYALDLLIDSGLVALEEILEIAQRAYKPALKALACHTDPVTSTLYLFTHAPTGLQDIYKLADRLKVNVRDECLSDLAAGINAMNLRFQQHVQANTVHTLYNSNQFDKDATHDTPFEYLMWNRNYADLHRPEKYRDYHLCFIHGHDRQEPTQNNIYNLDNFLGKMDHLNKGEYTVFISSETHT